MFQNKSTKVQLEKKDRPTSSAFADFFRKAPSESKKRIFIAVAKKASAEQGSYMN